MVGLYTFTLDSMTGKKNKQQDWSYKSTMFKMWTEDDYANGKRVWWNDWAW